MHGRVDVVLCHAGVGEDALDGFDHVAGAEARLQHFVLDVGGFLQGAEEVLLAGGGLAGDKGVFDGGDIAGVLHGHGGHDHVAVRNDFFFGAADDGFGALAGAEDHEVDVLGPGGAGGALGGARGLALGVAGDGGAHQRLVAQAGNAAGFPQAGDFRRRLDDPEFVQNVVGRDDVDARGGVFEPFGQVTGQVEGTDQAEAAAAAQRLGKDVLEGRERRQRVVDGVGHGDAGEVADIADVVPDALFAGVFFALRRPGENRLAGLGDEEHAAFEDRPEVADVAEVFLAVFIAVDHEAVQLALVQDVLDAVQAGGEFRARDFHGEAPFRG